MIKQLYNWLTTKIHGVSNNFSEIQNVISDSPRPPPPDPRESLWRTEYENRYVTPP